MLSAIHTLVAGVAIGPAVIVFRESILDASRDIPAMIDADDCGRTGGYACPLRTARAGVKTVCLSWSGEFLIDQDGGSEGYPGAVLGVNNDAQDAGRSQT